MGWTPVIHTVRPWIGTGLNGLEPVIAILVGDGATDTAEIRIDGGEIALLLVAITPTGIGLPEFQKRAGNAAPRWSSTLPCTRMRGPMGISPGLA